LFEILLIITFIVSIETSISRSLDVVCAGVICADVMARPVDRLPERGKLNLIDGLSLHIGGCAANAAIDLARMGARTGIAARIGSDGFGSFLESTLKNENIDIRGLKKADTPSSASVVAIGSDAERSILHCLGANGSFRHEDIDPPYIAEASVLFIAGTFLMPSFDGSGTEALLRDAKEAKVLCCLDTAWDSSGQWMKKIKTCLPLLDWFMPSYEEAMELSGEREPERIAGVFLAQGASNVVIKLGSKGCYIKPAAEEGRIVQAFSEIKAVDTSGAGDAFCAGFIRGLLLGKDPFACARLGNAAGACCVSAVGTTTGIHSLADIMTISGE